MHRPPRVGEAPDLPKVEASAHIRARTTKPPSKLKASRCLTNHLPPQTEFGHRSPEGGRVYRCNREPANRWNRNGEPAEPVGRLDGSPVSRRSASRLVGRLIHSVGRSAGRWRVGRFGWPVGRFGWPVGRSGQRFGWPVRLAGWTVRSAGLAGRPVRSAGQTVWFAGRQAGQTVRLAGRLFW